MVGDSFDVNKVGFLYLTVVKISDQNRKSFIIVNPTEVHAMSSADDILAGHQSPATEEEYGTPQMLTSQGYLSTGLTACPPAELQTKVHAMVYFHGEGPY